MFMETEHILKLARVEREVVVRVERRQSIGLDKDKERERGLSVAVAW